MNFFGIGLPEMAVIAAIGLLVFGPKRLPELGRTLGRTLRGFQSASREFEQEFRTAIHNDTAEASPAAGLAAGPGAMAPATAAPATAAAPEASSAAVSSPAGGEAEPAVAAAAPPEPGTGG